MAVNSWDTLRGALAGHLFVSGQNGFTAVAHGYNPRYDGRSPAEVARSGVGIPGGSCPSVGVAGLALGGGRGVLSRAWGLTSDQLRGAEVVLGEGRVVQADARSNPDLFWALRGGVVDPLAP